MSKSPKYSLFILMLIYLSNYIDRVSIGIFADHIKADLGLSDTQLGLISGLVFALFYAVLGIPIGRLADRYSRKTILSVCLSVWSFATAICGLCQNFAQLAAARMAVGVGEAGCTPTAHSFMSDIFAPNKRATAFSIYSMGPPMGVIIGAIAGGWIAHVWGWRIGMIALGAPGLLLALIVMLTIREPERGTFDGGEAGERAPGFREVISLAAANPKIVLVLFGIGFCAIGLYSISSFTVPFLMRGYGMDVLQAGTLFGLSYGVAGAIGALCGGAVTDWAGSRHPRWYTGVPMLVYAIGGPLMALAFFQSDYRMFAALFVLGSLIVNMALAPAVAVLVNQVMPRMRGSMSAIALFFSAVIGHGLGPTLTGYLSDRFAAANFGGGYAQSCKAGGDTAIAELCRQSSFHGLQHALALAAAFWLVSAAFYAAATFGGRQNRADEAIPA